VEGRAIHEEEGGATVWVSSQKPIHQRILFRKKEESHSDPGEKQESYTTRWTKEPAAGKKKGGKEWCGQGEKKNVVTEKNYVLEGGGKIHGCRGRGRGNCRGKQLEYRAEGVP